MSKNGCVNLDAEKVLSDALNYQKEYDDVYQYLKEIHWDIDNSELLCFTLRGNGALRLTKEAATPSVILSSMTTSGRLLARRLLESLVDLKYVPGIYIEQGLWKEGTVMGGMFRWDNSSRQWESGPLYVGSKGVDLETDVWEGTFCNKIPLTQLEKFVLGGILKRMYLKVDELHLPGRAKEQEDRWIKYLTDGGSV